MNFLGSYIGLIDIEHEKNSCLKKKSMQWMVVYFATHFDVYQLIVLMESVSHDVDRST